MPRRQNAWLFVPVPAWLRKTSVVCILDIALSLEQMLKRNIGTTIHAWGAVTPGVFDVEKQISYIKTCRPAHRRWKTVKVLVIDEGALKQCLTGPSLPAFIDAAVLSIHGRRSAIQPPSRPRSYLAEENRQAIWGHSGNLTMESALPESSHTDCEKVIVTGDFFQLPPVTQGGKNVFFAFQSDAWKESIEHTVTLTQVFRQKDSGKSCKEDAFDPEHLHVIFHLQTSSACSTSFAAARSPQPHKEL